MKIKKLRKADIWCEVTCQRCNTTYGFYYKNPSTISNMKQITQKWATVTFEDDTCLQLCPDCIKKLKAL